MVGIKEVAELAGVSLSTVSRVLNQPNLVKSETKEKIYAAMEELGYKPPKRDIRDRSYTIGLAIPDVKIDFIGELIRRIEQELDNTPYDLLLFNMKRNRKISRYFRENAAFKKKVDALIIFSASLDDESVDFFRSLNIPIVLLQSRCKREKSISTNNYLGASDAVNFLLSRGYKKIAFIGWEPEDDHIVDRFNGYKNALEKAGINYENNWFAFDELSRDGGYRATAKLFEQFKPEAIFYACDSMAFGGYQFFNEKKINIPEDLGVIGFDDLDFASVLNLTTMRQFLQTKAKMAITYLLARLSGEIKAPVGEEICITPEVVVRKSTK